MREIAAGGNESGGAAEAFGALRERFARLPVTLDEDLTIEPAPFSAYGGLASHHYRAGRPMAATTVFVVRDDRPTVVGRFLRREQTREVVGVLVRSLPRLDGSLRDVATGGRYRGLRPHERAAMLNREMRVISRVVIDPRYRGLGLAVRLVRHALDHAETPYTEALAAMGRVNPFFERAGMTRYERPHHPAHARLLYVLDEIGLTPGDLTSTKRVETRLRNGPCLARMWLETELIRWATRALRLSRQRAGDLTFERCLELARDRLLVRPVYYLYRSDAPGR